MRKILFLFLATSFISVSAQEKKEEPRFGINFGGFVKTDAFYDSRQNVSIREGHFLLYPDNISKDADGKDINARSNFNILSIQTRLKGGITGPDAFGAKTSGLIEADFFGNESAGLIDANGFRLRHAFVKLNWKKTELLAGQFWNPFFITESYPDVISFNTGAPFQPFSRNPQIRVTHKIGLLSLIGSILSERDFQSTGPDGSSTKYMRNAAMPEGNFQVQFKADSSDHLFGVGVDYKSLLPELYSQNNAKTKKFVNNETINSMSGMAFMKLKFKPITVKVQGVYAQNATDLTMIGGYAVKNILDTATGAKEYTNLNTASGWIEFQTNGKKIQYALFTGYTQNLGSKDTISGAIYARGANIQYVYRVAPRVVFISGKLNVALEAEYTFAMYGITNGDKKGKPTNNKAVENWRGMLAFIYKF